MSPKTLTVPPTDRSMWRRLLRLAHPDSGGEHDLFIWADSLRSYVTGEHVGPEPPRMRREPPKRPPRTSGRDRVPFGASVRFGSFEELTQYALKVGERVGRPYADLLRLLEDLEEAGPEQHTLRRAEQVGATYRSLAALAHRVGMTKWERVLWYQVCASIPLSQRHCGHIFARLEETDTAT